MKIAIATAAVVARVAALLIPSIEAFAFRSALLASAGGARLGRGSDHASVGPRFASSDDVGDVMTPERVKKPQSFDDFDYSSHWYPVSWARDVPLNQPIRVTLFDVDYVLAKTSQGGERGNEDDAHDFYAMIDSCPHKKVALSEGRITDCGTPGKRYFQCSYHGE